MEIKILSLWVRIGLITSLIEWRLLGPSEDKMIVSCLQISDPMLSLSSNQEPWSFFNSISFTNSSFVYSTSVENFCVPMPFLKRDLSWFLSQRVLVSGKNLFEFRGQINFILIFSGLGISLWTLSNSNLVFRMLFSIFSKS